MVRISVFVAFSELRWAVQPRALAL